MKGRLFATGVPVVSTSAIAENEFLYGGNLMVASIIQGGAPPCFLKKWVYNYMVSGLCEELELSASDVAESEMKSFVDKVKKLTSILTISPLSQVFKTSFWLMRDNFIKQREDLGIKGLISVSASKLNM